MAAPKAGNIVRASDYPKVRFVKKAAAESVTNSAVLQDDDDLTIALDANKTYFIEAHLAASGPTAQDVRVAWAISGGVTVKANRMVYGPSSAVATAGGDVIRMTGAHALTTNLVYGTDGTNNSHISEWFAVETTTLGAAGTLTLQWAQGTAAAATTTTMQSTTFMVVTEVDVI